MKYQKIVYLLDNTSNQISKIRIKNWIKTNHQSRGIHNTNSCIRFKTTMLNYSLCDYSDAYIFGKGRTTNTRDRNNSGERRADERNRGVIFKCCTPFINSESEINKIEIDNAKDLDIVMLMHNLIEYSDNYSKTSRSLWQYSETNKMIDSG